MSASRLVLSQPFRSLHLTFATTRVRHRMPSLEILLNDHTVSAFSSLTTRLGFMHDIDLALKEVESAYKKSPVKQALKLFRRASKHLESQVFADENATVVILAKDVTSGCRNLVSLQLFEILLLRRALRTRRNSLASISRLPTEILTSILELCPKIDSDLSEFEPSKFVLGLTVSHVCRRWREIAMKSSQFWSYIALSQPRWALEMLHRSRATPLVVAVSFESSGIKHIAARDLVLAQISRIRQLHLHLPQRSSIPNSLLFTAPLLDTFHLHYSGPSEISVDMPLFGGGETASLRHMSLQYCLLTWDSPLFDNLVSLELIHSPVHVGLLARMPYLRALTLVESFPQTFPEPVALELETLKLTGDRMICYAFLRTISIPESCILLIQLNDPYGASDIVPLRHA
ncbi:hypothetical protein MVEN_01758300 [Mycena venus]|uniref:F-box domain-containing protein n=1 Tax=Mycena venus TaxID=2733690 RepID=A0A8H6XMT9_9AGAR|nr:hypothetical protein MVEN_01758300 [Mycena venus]